ncbi:MAG: CopG family transcriptional regulator [Candidatus Binataceae bacterium]
MSVVKVSVSLSDTLARFVEGYQKKRGVKRSEVFEEALKLLRAKELEAAYREANAECDEAWETAVADGLSDETW